jgi:hypothetical protein
LHLKSYPSNFFITLTDFNGNPLKSCSAGQVTDSRIKKQKITPMIINPMMNKIKRSLIKYKVKRLVLHIRTNITAHVFNVVKFLQRSNLKLHYTYLAFNKPIPHHFGRRKKKPRRI